MKNLHSIILLLSLFIMHGWAAPVILDDFNVNEGHFNQAPSFSGSTSGILGSSTADRVTTGGPLEGAGYEQLVIRTNGAASVRVRFLSGGGTPANNTYMTNSTEVDGWIGCYVRTTNTGWNVQIWLEGTSHNGSVPRDIVADGEWHLYEWDLDDTTGGTTGWGNVAGIVTGSAVVADGHHTIDSIIFRNPAIADGTNVLQLDFIAKTDSGSISNLFLDPCLSTTGVLVAGPVSTNVSEVTVAGVSASATQVKVYQNTGPSSAMVEIGSKTTGVTAGNNAVTVSGLEKGAQVAATQTINGQESCVPATGLVIGGGANPSVRIALTVRETTATSATIGAAGDTTLANLHFMGATTVSGGAPGDAPIVYPSNEWQTITFNLDRRTIGDAANTIGAVVETGVYNPNDIVTVRAFAYRTVLETGQQIFSRVAAQSASQTSNNIFGVNWTWDAVPDVDGYRLLRDVNGAGYLEFVDVPGTNFYPDTVFAWAGGDVVTPNAAQLGSSIQWNPANVNATVMPGRWGTLESINFVLDDLTDTGPFDLYIDNLQNGSTVFQTFEEAVAGTQDYGFRVPTFSGTTSGAILTSPDVGAVSGNAADASEKSFRVQFQWNALVATKWLRLTTSGVAPAGNPFVDLDQPVSFRLLLLPVGSTPVAPPAPSISISQIGDQTVLNWPGVHRLQAASAVTGSYTNVPNVTVGPYTNTFTEPQKFFRLAN